MDERPELVKQENKSTHTPMHLAAKDNKVDVLTVLLEHDPSLGAMLGLLESFLNIVLTLLRRKRLDMPSYSGIIWQGRK
ncbi:hypothetical protein U9M48_004384 [Paspalum notatum var. saurae]|uniref:Uncharacterized protein n=1 Tax=Paspalum notatum var. saurae TaxID=547442 RepID=A0AAQ3PNL5_PASNO